MQLLHWNKSWTIEYYSKFFVNKIINLENYGCLLTKNRFRKEVQTFKPTKPCRMRRKADRIVVGCSSSMWKIHHNKTKPKPETLEKIRNIRIHTITLDPLCSIFLAEIAHVGFINKPLESFRKSVVCISQNFENWFAVSIYKGQN